MKRLEWRAAAALAVLALVGCRTTEGRCEDFCVVQDDCDDSIDIDDCVDDCVEVYDDPDTDETCRASFDALADCASDFELDCELVLDECENESEDFVADCSDS